MQMRTIIGPVLDQTFDGGIDNELRISVYDASSNKVTEILDGLGVSSNTREFWQKKRNGKTLTVIFDFGPCSHQHDCCGCIIERRLEMSMTGKFLNVYTYTSRNY